ncbi:UDP-glucose ceramide glucosyltransferase-like isoform [Chlorella sorokiniana]|uniref:UDP-glucose ceramide glucosyltransferase-like isoform n=1 Tax=Chlorella sorokiniana TaxID=3076 RepID=A0A2P6TEQ9_CHLSO|nr:UDP-glucose ceramide glucosyltransferase-like isoform [Chlorella sorokiniana]|eukprot:PRW21129.1 UDP-glucose ceramide glucosyltransferase-like isoform [Chlorella sorokiniana]
MAAVAAALGFRGPLAAPGRRSGFAACRPPRKSIHAAPLLQPRQAPVPLPQAVRRGKGAQPPRWTWAGLGPATLQDRLFNGTILLILALILYLGGFPTDAGYMLALALLVMLRPF